MGLSFMLFFFRKKFSRYGNNNGIIHVIMLKEYDKVISVKMFELNVSLIISIDFTNINFT